ncbi:protein of unknown function [Vibrio tapetis subsp. tapetis]|uniref:Uncharacterized protein n=1 Tax=Vibrio tapetis subsp. tapetis TaxID=1671868 RepID=A0A2N8ZAP0_9VIBR|nr:protein of unknown function [Vibrio tapetis subsp. tapetis]
MPSPTSDNLSLVKTKLATLLNAILVCVFFIRVSMRRYRRQWFGLTRN